MRILRMRALALAGTAVVAGTAALAIAPTTAGRVVRP